MRESFFVYENIILEDSEVKIKKKKKKKKKLNKIVLMEGEEIEFSLFNVWGILSSILNGFLGSSGVFLRRLELLGLFRILGIVKEIFVM